MIDTFFTDEFNIGRTRYRKTYWGYWDSAKDFYKQSNEWFDAIPSRSAYNFKDSDYKNYLSGKESPSVDWEGTDKFDELENINSFLNQDVLNTVTSRANEILSKIKLGGAFEPKRMVATSMPNGVFDFSLASKGLYRPQEYYCKAINRIIDANDVTKISSNPPLFAFYQKQPDGTIKSYKVIQQQKGVQSEKEKKYTYQTALDAGNPPIIAQQIANKKHPYAGKKFATTTKKVYLTRQGTDIGEDKGKEKYVDIFMPIGGLNNIEVPTLTWSIFPYLLLSMLLEKAGFKIKILGWYQGAYNIDARRASYGISYTVKDYDEKLNNDRIARFIADTRTFRWQLFKATDAIWQTKFNKTLGSLGSQVATDEQDLYFARYRNWLITEVKKGNTNLNNLNPDLMLFQSLDLNELQDEISSDTQEEWLLNYFYQMIDRIDFAITPAAIALNNILERAKASKIPLKDALENATLAKNMATLMVDGGIYDDSQKRKEKLTDLRLKLNKDLREAKKKIP